MLKKFFLVSSILAVTSTIALASPAPYVGGSIGIINNTVDFKSDRIENATFGSYRGVPFSVFAGYGGVVSQNFYLAGELSGTVATANISENTDLKTNYSYGASVIPGLMVSDHSMLYGRAGVVRSHFTSGSGETRTGGQFGVGLQTSLTQNIDVRGEYDFVASKSVSDRDAFGARFTASPRSDQFNLGLVYKFD